MTKIPGSDDPVVHYVALSDKRDRCRNAIIAGPALPEGGLRDLAVFFRDITRQIASVEYDNDPAEPAGGTWHFRAWCPELGRNAPARQERSDRSEDPELPGRTIIVGEPATFEAARAATSAEPVWIMSGINGHAIAVIIPAPDYHPPGTCCCSNCPWNGNHGTEKNDATA